MPLGDGDERLHAGAREGPSASELVHDPDDTTPAVVFASLPENHGAFTGDLVPALRHLIASSTAWRDSDLW